MQVLCKISFFIWFSFIYRTVHCDFKSESSKNDIARAKQQFRDNVEVDLSVEQQRQLLQELKELSPERKQQLFDEFQKQRRDFERSRSKWSRLRDTLPQPDELLPVNQEEVDSVRAKLRSGSVPVVRDKRTLKFLIKELAEILGLRWTLLKYSLVVPLINNLVTPPNASAAPAPAPAAPPRKPFPSSGPPARPPPPPRKPAPPPPRRLPPPPPPKRPPPPPPKQPPQPPAPPRPAAPPASPSAPPTIPPNQIDPNTIRYPFRPAPTIPILTFASLPPGVTVPYPILFQWPATPAAPAPAPANPAAPKGPPQQPPCAAPPRVAPPPSRVPLPKPRPPVPPRPKPVPPTPASGPSKTPLKLEYDHPVRIEIFNNVKPYLPVSGTVYSGDPTLASVEEEGPTAYFENPTQAVVQAINDQYNTEPNEENRDYDYGFYTPSQLNIEEDPGTTPPRVVDYYDNHQNYDETTRPHSNPYSTNVNYDDSTTIHDSNNINDNRNYDAETTTTHYNNYYDDSQYNNDREETTTNRYNEGFVSNIFQDDYPEQVEENRAHVNIKVSNLGRPKDSKFRVSKRMRKPKKVLKHRAEESKVEHKWGSGPKKITLLTSPLLTMEGTPVSLFTTTSSKKTKKVDKVTVRRPKTSTTTEFPRNHSKPFSRGESRQQLENILPTSNEKLSYQTRKGSFGKSYMTFSRQTDPKKPSNEFRIIVPHARRRRDIFFDDEFKNFDKTFESFKDKPIPTSTQSQFLDVHDNGQPVPPITQPHFLENPETGQLTPDEEYRKKLEKDVEKYVEHYVEQQISQGVIDPNKPKTTVIELKTKTGPPIKTITTTLSKQIEGDKNLLESILEYSKEINPVSNIGELGAQSSGVDPTQPSEVSKAFMNDHFQDEFSRSFENKG